MYSDELYDGDWMLDRKHDESLGAKDSSSWTFGINLILTSTSVLTLLRIGIVMFRWPKFDVFTCLFNLSFIIAVLSSSCL